MQAYSLVLDIISGCWLVFVAIWVLAAVSTKRTVYRETPGATAALLGIAGDRLLLLLYGRRLPYPLNLGIVPHVAPTAWAAAVLCVIGLAFALWARVTLGGTGAVW
jgi:hypothetical protein